MVFRSCSQRLCTSYKDESHRLEMLMFSSYYSQLPDPTKVSWNDLQVTKSMKNFSPTAGVPLAAIRKIEVSEEPIILHRMYIVDADSGFKAKWCPVDAYKSLEGHLLAKRDAEVVYKLMRTRTWKIIS
ncbi:hypothetical protein LINPERPRIM_LOCUS1251 [Linum perenne]